MKLLTEQLEDLVSDVDNINPKTYDYGWRATNSCTNLSKPLKLDLLPVTIRRGWWLYRERHDSCLLYEINQ